jgi:hypothetical protein
MECIANNSWQRLGAHGWQVKPVFPISSNAFAPFPDHEGRKGEVEVRQPQTVAMHMKKVSPFFLQTQLGCRGQ